VSSKKLRNPTSLKGNPILIWKCEVSAGFNKFFLISSIDLGATDAI